MMKSQKSESYLVDEKNVLINKFELHFLLNQKNKKKYLKDLKLNDFLKLKTSSSVFQSIGKCKTFVGESIPVLGENKEIFGIVGNKEIISFVGICLVLIFCTKGFIAYFVQRKILSLGYEIRTNIVEKLINSYQKKN